jgi:hypothetical protein
MSLVAYYGTSDEESGDESQENKSENQTHPVITSVPYFTVNIQLYISDCYLYSVVLKLCIVITINRS